MKSSTFFSKQARKPTGLYGRFRMSKVFDKGNIEMNSFAKQMLDIEKDDVVLEIGCGTGRLVNEISKELENGIIEGIDFSKTMTSIAKKNNKKNIRKGKVNIHTANFDEFSFNENSYDKIFSINTIYFWENPKLTVSKIVDLLKPNGTLVLGFHKKEDMIRMDLDDDVFRYYSEEDVVNLLSIGGKLKDINVNTKESYPKCICCAVGIKK